MRSLVRDGQTSSHRPRLAVSLSTCPPLHPQSGSDPSRYRTGLDQSGPDWDSLNRTQVYMVELRTGILTPLQSGTYRTGGGESGTGLDSREELSLATER